MPSEQRNDMTHLPTSTTDDMRAMTRRAGHDLPEELMQRCIVARPVYRAIVRRIPRGRTCEQEPAHVFQAPRLA